MRRARKKMQFILGILCIIVTPLVSAKGWQRLAVGIEYRDLTLFHLSEWSHIHVFRLDLLYQNLTLVMAKDLPKQHGSAKLFKQFGQGVIAINSGFFNPKGEPIGLRISAGNVLNPLKAISWWGVFTITDHRASISAYNNFHNHKGIDFAVQAGPRLLIGQQIPGLKAGYANRSALGIDSRGRVIVLVTENMPLSTHALAEIMQKKPLSCVDALNLDGGSSSQLYAQIGDFTIDVPGLSQVSDAIVVKPYNQAQ